MLAIAAKTILELAVVLLLIYGFIKEDKVIAFEQKVKMIVVVNYRRYKKRKKLEKIQKERAFKVYDGRKTSSAKKAPNAFHVA